MLTKVVQTHYGYFKILKKIDFKIFKLWMQYNGFNNIFLDFLSTQKLFYSMTDVERELEYLEEGVQK